MLKRIDMVHTAVHLMNTPSVWLDCMGVFHSGGSLCKHKLLIFTLAYMCLVLGEVQAEVVNALAELRKSDVAIVVPVE